MNDVEVTISGTSALFLDDLRSGADTAEHLPHTRHHLFVGKFRMALRDHRCLELPRKGAERLGHAQAVLDRKRPDGLNLDGGGLRIHASQSERH